MKKSHIVAVFMLYLSGITFLGVGFYAFAYHQVARYYIVILISAMIFISLLCWTNFSRKLDKDIAPNRRHPNALAKYDFFPRRAHGDTSDRVFDFDAFLYCVGAIVTDCDFDTTKDRKLRWTLACEIGDNIFILVTELAETANGDFETCSSFERRSAKHGVLSSVKLTPHEALVRDSGTYNGMPVARKVFNLWRQQITATSHEVYGENSSGPA